jgi:hypothetical protein
MIVLDEVAEAVQHWRSIVIPHLDTSLQKDTIRARVRHMVFPNRKHVRVSLPHPHDS